MNTFTIIFQTINNMGAHENTLSITEEFDTQQLTEFALLSGIKDISHWMKKLIQNKLHLVSLNSSNQIQGIISGDQEDGKDRVIAIDSCVFIKEKNSVSEVEIETLSEILRDLIIKFEFNGIKIPNETRVMRKLSNNFLYFNDLRFIPSKESSFDFFKLKTPSSEPFIA